MSLMRISVVFLILGLVSFVAAQNPCNFGRMEEKIDLLIKKHQASAEDKEFVKIGSFYVEDSNDTPANSLSGVKPFIFHFAPGRTFRFYVLSDGIDSKVTLMQKAGGILEHAESKVLFQAVHEGSHTGIAYYDYYLEEANDFQLLFSSVRNTSGCAVMVFVEIAPEY